MKKKDNLTMTVCDSNGEIATINSEKLDKFFGVSNDPDKNITIKKAKIKDDIFLEAEYSEELIDHGTKTTKLSCTVPVNQDLKDAFHKLHIHLAILCDEHKIDDPDYINIDELSFDDFGVRSFTIGGSGDSEGVVISGYKEGKYGVVNLNTPFLQYENSDYSFKSELSSAVDVCMYEVKQYLFHGKRAPEAQLEINFPDADNETINEE